MLSAILTGNDMAGKMMAADATGKQPLLASVQNLNVDGSCSVFVKSTMVAAADIAYPNGAISMIATLLMPRAISKRRRDRAPLFTMVKLGDDLAELVPGSMLQSRVQATLVQFFNACLGWRRGLHRSQAMAKIKDHPEFKPKSPAPTQDWQSSMQPIALVTAPTRAAGLARLHAFVPHAGRHYQARRNHDLGPENRGNVSMLSPYIRHRLITEHEVLASVLQQHSREAAEKFVQEVFWRTYFKGHLETRPFVWASYRQAVQSHVNGLGQKGGLRKPYENAVEGKTGIDCFDAWVEELLATGYLHNRSRMWFASIWIFTLKLPWQLGADFMYRHLLDGDAASNTLSWRWVGGLHTKGKTYLARADNIRTYTQGRFNPDGLARDAPPLKEASMQPAVRLRDAASAWPIGKVGLLLTEEDLHPELPEPCISEIVAVARAAMTSVRSPLAVAPLVKAFAEGAMADALARAASRLSVEAMPLAALSGGAIEDWARANKLATLATANSPVGPVAEQLPAIAAHLGTKGIRFIEIRRGFDARAWPHARRGFFGLKEKIPELLNAMGIVDGK